MAKKKKSKKSFLQRAEGPFQSFLANISLSDAVDFSAGIGSAYMGYLWNRHYSGAILGLVSYKLATTGGGTPPVSQLAGVAGLSLIGAGLAAPTLKEEIKEALEDALKSKGAINVPYPDISPDDMYWKMPWEGCKVGYTEPRPMSTRCIKTSAWEKSRQMQGGGSGVG